MVIIFIIISFFLDLYLLNYFPNFVSDVELNEYPNIILISIDTLRPDHLSLYGYSLNTSPNLDEFAKDAVVFNNAITAGGSSLLSIASIFTGKYVSNHNASVLNQKLDSKETTLAEILKAKGYNTAGFTTSVYTKAKYGFWEGFITYKDRIDFLNSCTHLNGLVLGKHLQPLFLITSL
jgi:arylsulfatase A-like enzyme